MEINSFIDMDAICDFIFTKEDRDVDTNLEETYGTDEKQEIILLTKVRRENKASDHSQHEAIRYEFVKSLLSVFDDVEVDIELNKINFDTLSQQLAWNTLIKYGFVKNI